MNWTLLKTDLDVYIKTDTFELYVGDADTITPEEWRTIHTIVQAPALLEACKAFLEWATTEHTDYKDFRRVQDLARAAIAAAEGEQ